MSTWKFLLHLDSASGCWAGGVRAVNTAQQGAGMTTIPHFLAAFPTSEELWLQTTLHGLSVSTAGDDLFHEIRTRAAVLKAFLLAFVPKLAVRPHLTANLKQIFNLNPKFCFLSLILLSHLPALVLLVSAVVGVAGELAGVATRQPRVTGKVAAALGEVLSDVFVSNDSLKLKLFIKGLRKA